MKLFKKLLSYIIAFTMVLSLATLLGGNVHAADNESHVIKINDAPTGRTYVAYQILKGDYSDGTLSNVEWGDNVTPATLLSELVADTHFFNGINTGSSAKTVAEKLKPGIDTDQAKAFAKYAEASKKGNGFASTENTETKITTITVKGSGYYLVLDTTPKDSQSSKNESYTRYIVKVVGGTDETVINLKGTVPTVEKKVKDTNESTGVTSGWQDSADYKIGADVPYQITGTMPANIADYTSYKYVFTDTMSKGLTYDGTAATETKAAKRGNATIEIGKTDSNGSFKADKDVTTSFAESVTTKEDGSTVVTWTCDDLKGIKDATIDENTKVVVTYSAKLNENAVFGSAGNPNTVNLTYSNNPNKGGDGETGKTPDDKNIVFTYKTVVNKVDQTGQSLKGAAFKLEKKLSDGTYKEVKSFTAGETTTFEFNGLDDGVYKLTETATPAGYNSIDPIEFTITATHSEKADEPKLLTFSGKATNGEVTFNADQDAGSLTTNVVNQKGSELPSTGGMGTTLLYVAGGILVACAAAYVVLNKKRA